MKVIWEAGHINVAYARVESTKYSQYEPCVLNYIAIQ